MDVLYVASECAPFVKTGGLADVIGAVPKALAPLGADVKILLPAYPALLAILNTGALVASYDDLFDGPAKLVSVQAEGLDLLLLDAPHLYDRAGSIYLDETGQDWHDNHLRFGALCRVATDIAREGVADWTPQITHVHDWQAGLVPLLIELDGMAKPPATIVTVHNVAFQGLFQWETKNLFNIPDEHFTSEGAEYWGQLGFLKAGLAYADAITTVSPTYARELLTPEFGMGLEGVFQARQDDLSGIINGIDLDAWNPKTDPHLAKSYTARSLGRKDDNRAVLAGRFSLTKSDGPLFCVVSRLTEQKGLDLLLEVLPTLVENGAQLALLGSGDPDMEAAFREAQKQHKGQVGVIIGYDENLSHLMQGGSDAILVPSRFEPCGLTQLYGLRYGTLPVVATTGGLADTVTDVSPETIKAKTATGFHCEPGNAASLRHAITRTCEAYADRDLWRVLQRNAMRQPVGWDGSAPTYLALYKKLLEA
ncbi:glycogen synthase GlgA [Ahrensia sp. R2A130]|uniref:glycogen synthase GlgA n=1 Tax=Ahrensia sp. R2A130 TaxID=744979 RepID=UPI0001E083DD|nr:glycogen synthase GlgA [Ahrensia sp. R2A130]EFL89520.1 glycogen synthase 1 [Ahrensia sp. R2A130]